MTGSAKQSILQYESKSGLLRRFAPLRKRFAFVAGNDGRIYLRVLAARCARVTLESFARWRAWRYPTRGERGMPGARCTRSRACRVVSTRVSHHGRSGITRHSRTRVVLTVSFALSPVIGLCCHRYLAEVFFRKA